MKYVIILLIFLLIPLVYAESTFFDQEDTFIMGNSAAEEPAPESGTTGGTGGGEGGGSCVTNWTCASWSSCTNGIQTRNCTKEKADCYADLKIKPMESQNCSIRNSENKSAEENLIEVNKEEKPVEIPKDESAEKNQIEKPNYPFVAITLVTILVLGWIYYLLKKK